MEGGRSSATGKGLFRVSSVSLFLIFSFVVVLLTARPAAAQTSNQASCTVVLNDNGQGQATVTLNWLSGYDANFNASATVSYRLYPAHPALGGPSVYTGQTVSRAGGQNQVALDLLPGRYYDFRVEISDPDGVVGGAVQENLGVLLRDDRFRFVVVASNPHPGPQYDEALVRDIVSGKLFWSSNQGQWEYGNAYEYTLLGGVLSEFAVNTGKTAWQSVADGDGRIYLAGEMPRGDGSHRYRAMIGIVNEGANPSFVANLVPYTDDVNEFIGVAMDRAGNRLLAGERGPGTPLTDSGWPQGGGLWSIPLHTINSPNTYLRVYQDPAYREWTHLMIFNGRLYAQMSNGSVISAPLSAVTFGMQAGSWTTEFAFGITAMIVSRDGGKLFAVSDANAAAGDFSTIFTNNGAGWSDGVRSKAYTPFGLAELPDGRLLHEVWLNSNSHVACVSDPATGDYEFLEGGNLGATIPGVGMGGANYNYLYSGNSIFYGTVSPGKIIQVSYLAPTVANVQPAGAIYAELATVSASYADASGAGIDTASVAVNLDGAALGGCSVGTTQVSCPVNNLSPGHHVINGQVADNAGNVSPIKGDFIVANRRSFFTWYDGAGASDWVLMSNAVGVGQDAWFDLHIAGSQRGLPLRAGLAPGQVPAGRTITPSYAGLMGGPIDVRYFASGNAIVSQRILWAGSSLEEVVATDQERLSSHYYWAWYDMASPGYKNWVLVANPNSYDIYYEIKLAGESVANGGPIAPGDNVTPTFPGRMGGPVEVLTFADPAHTQPADSIASQRVLMHADRAFNEVVGTPAEELADRYLWTWYDQQSEGATNWVLVANPNDIDLYYEIKIGGLSAASGGPIAPGGHVTPTFPGRMGGPVEALTFADPAHTLPAKSIASQRVLWGPSFSDTPGYPAGSLFNALGSSYLWTWYDQQSAWSQNWVLVANPGGAPIYYEIRIAGSAVASGGPIAPGGNATPIFPGTMGGPVQVLTFTDVAHTVAADSLASQRVLWNGYFNEVMGTPQSPEQGV